MGTIKYLSMTASSRPDGIDFFQGRQILHKNLPYNFKFASIEAPSFQLFFHKTQTFKHLFHKKTKIFKSL